MAKSGITQQDLEWARRAEQRIVVALLLASALGWGFYSLLATKLFYPLLVIRALIVGICLVFVTAFVLIVPAESVLYLASPRYRRVRRYERARKKLRARHEAHGA
ncbi:MAG: hypothetical protein IH606_17250 [Burkholderiales bacterium]|nr:hypothetical protein [Burkholderiales bacterium]